MNFTTPYDIGLARGLSTAGAQVFLFGLQMSQHRSTIDARVATLDLNVKPLPKPRFRGRLLKHAAWLAYMSVYAAALISAAREIARIRPDIVHVQWAVLPLLDAQFVRFLRRSTTVVGTIHDTTVSNGDPAIWYRAHGFSRYLSQLDRLFVHTKQGKSRLEVMLRCSSDKVVVVPHGCARRLPLASAPRPRPGGKLRFLSFGQIKPYKGVDVLIEAAALLSDHAKAVCEFQVVGTPVSVSAAELKALAKARGVEHLFRFDLRFIPDDEIDAVFGNADIAVLPYREIEASGAFMLAIEHGLPVIASRIGLFDELIVDGQHGSKVQAGDPESLSVALETFVNGGRALLHQACEHMLSLRASLPDWDQVGRETVASYQSLLHPRP